MKLIKKLLFKSYTRKIIKILRYRKLKIDIKYILLIIVISTDIFIYGYLLGYGFIAENIKKYKNMRILAEMIDIITNEYDGTVTKNELINSAAKGMAESLDDYSYFLTPEESKKRREEYEGKYYGTGIYTDYKQKPARIIRVIYGSPAYRAGIMPGDFITKINGESIENMSIKEIMRKRSENIYQKRSSLGILRNNKEKMYILEKKTMNLICTKGTILKNNVGYILITEFSNKTDKETEKILMELSRKGMKRLIIDLRDNPGGIVQVTNNICNNFIGNNKVLEILKNTKLKNKIIFKAKKKAYYSNLPVSILVNNYSASASELFAGIFQDLKRGAIIGSRTFGKGCSQSGWNLGDGYNLMLTVNKIYLPSGRCYHGQGIEPDITVNMPVDAENKIRAQREKYIYLKNNPKTIMFMMEDKAIKTAYNYLTNN